MHSELPAQWCTSFVINRNTSIFNKNKALHFFHFTCFGNNLREFVIQHFSCSFLPLLRRVFAPLLLQIEEQQRADVRERKENGVEWEQKYFHLEGENWVYNTPLDKRRSEILSQTEQ